MLKMNSTTKRVMTNKWLLVMNEYELIKQKKSKNFSTVDQLCEIFKVHRKDIRKYYERWINLVEIPIHYCHKNEDLDRVN